MSALSDGNKTAERMQADIVARISAMPECVDVNVFADDPEDPVAMQSILLGLGTPKAGKIGLMVVVRWPAASRTNETPFGPKDLIWQIEVYENRLTNKDTANDGTGKRGGSLADVIEMNLRFYTAGGICANFITRKNECITTDVAYLEGGDKAVGITLHTIHGTSREADTQPFTKVPTPQITPAVPQGETITQTGELHVLCSDPAALVYITTDGSYPWAGNPAAALRDDDGFLLSPAGTYLLRAVANKPGSIDSDVNARLVIVP